jgi:hypothetical protein
MARAITNWFRFARQRHFGHAEIWEFFTVTVATPWFWMHAPSLPTIGQEIGLASKRWLRFPAQSAVAGGCPVFRASSSPWLPPTDQRGSVPPPSFGKPTCTFHPASLPPLPFRARCPGSPHRYFHARHFEQVHSSDADGLPGLARILGQVDLLNRRRAGEVPVVS